MTKFIFVRHGETTYNRDHMIQGWLDSPLTEEGLVQSASLGQRLPADIDLAFSSDLGRAKHTLEIILETYGKVPTFYDWRIRERHLGVLQNKPKDQPRIEETFTDPSVSIHQAEPIDFMDERIKSFLRDCLAFEVETILVIGHSGILKRLNCLFEHGNMDKSFANASAYELTFTADDPRLAAKPVKPWRLPADD